MLYTYLSFAALLSVILALTFQTLAFNQKKRDGTVGVYRRLSQLAFLITGILLFYITLGVKREHNSEEQKKLQEDLRNAVAALQRQGAAPERSDFPVTVTRAIPSQEGEFKQMEVLRNVIDRLGKLEEEVRVSKRQLEVLSTRTNDMQYQLDTRTNEGLHSMVQASQL